MISEALVGDTVQISYEGEIDETNANTIADAISAFKVTISNRDVSIPEKTISPL